MSKTEVMNKKWGLAFAIVVLVWGLVKLFGGECRTGASLIFWATPLAFIVGCLAGIPFRGGAIREDGKPVLSVWLTAALSVGLCGVFSQSLNPDLFKLLFSAPGYFFGVLIAGWLLIPIGFGVGAVAWFIARTAKKKKCWLRHYYLAALSSVAFLLVVSKPVVENAMADQHRKAISKVQVEDLSMRYNPYAGGYEINGWCQNNSEDYLAELRLEVTMSKKDFVADRRKSESQSILDEWNYRDGAGLLVKQSVYPNIMLRPGERTKITATLKRDPLPENLDWIWNCHVVDVKFMDDPYR